jgi:hypothetical protein
MHAISRDRSLIKKEAGKFLKYKDLRIQTQGMWNIKIKSYATNNRGNWNHFKIIQKIPEELSGKVRNQGTTENSHISHCTHTAAGTNVKVRNIQHGK